MRILSLLGRTGVRLPRFLGTTPRALPVLATVQQHLFSSHEAALPVLAAPTIKHEQPNLRVLQLVAAGSVLGVIAQSYEPANCGKRKKNDSQVEDDMYEVDHIKARKLEKGVAKYLISWKGYNDDSDTWEGLENLAGFEPDIAAFEIKQKKDNEEFAAVLRAKKLAKEQAKGKKATVALPGAGTGEGSREGNGAGSSSDVAVVVKQEALGGRRTNPFWAKVKPSANPNEPNEYLCQEPDPSKPGGICGCLLHPGAGATAIKRHFAAKHKRSYQEIAGYLNADTMDVGALATDGAQRTIKAQPFSDARRDECNMACARWLVKSARPITLPERDGPFRDFVSTLCRGAWDPPSHHAVNDCILKLSGMGQVRMQRWFADMAMDGVKPSMAGDIWSDGGCSLMGICLYGINSSWKMDEWLAAATPFGSVRHTGEAIDQLTVDALKRQGVKWRARGRHSLRGNPRQGLGQRLQHGQGLGWLRRRILRRPHDRAGGQEVHGRARRQGGLRTRQGHCRLLPPLHLRHPRPHCHTESELTAAGPAHPGRGDALVLVVRHGRLVSRAAAGGADVRREARRRGGEE